MIPHSYTVDSLSQSQELASKILSSSTPQQILSACSSIESFVHSHSSDHSRHFFSISFPTLILKLFGFANESSSATSPPQSNGWIDVISSSNDPDLAARVFHLLSPNGVIFSSMQAVDRKSLVKFVFPTERLPEWARYMLSTEKDVKILSNLCPIFKGKVKEDSIKGSASMYQIQLNVFEYYMFWFAYYPISRGNNENDVSNSLMKRTIKDKFRLENWTNSIPGFTSNVKRGASQKIECNPYLRLLYAYLREFVPVSDLNGHQQPYRSSLLNYTSGYDGSVIMRAEFLVNTLVNYWLIDNDFSPLSVNVCKWYGVSYPIRSLLGETPPTSGFGEVVKLFVKYLNLSSIAVSSVCGSNVECSGSPKWRSPDSCSVLFNSGVNTKDLVSVMSCATAGCSWNSYIQRPLYRYILRTFLFCPIGTSIKNASEVFSVWVCYMEPWNITLDDFAELDEVFSGSSKNERKDDSQPQACGYSSAWQGYVLSNYLYYSSLVMHFIGFAHKFLHTDPEVIVQMVLKVMNVLTSSKELIDLVKNVDTVFHSKQAGSSKSKLNGLYRFVPSIREQLQDWEDGLCESDADGSFLHENWNKDLRLFSHGEDGGQQLLQLFILRAEAELQAISGGNLAQNLQRVDSLKSHISCFFGGYAIKPIPFSLEVEQQSRDEIFRPKRVGNHALADIKYKGDWMKRPISDDEVAWLAKLLIWLSDWLNKSLRLNQPASSVVGPKWSYVEVSGENEGKVYGPTETMKTVLYAIRSLLLMLVVASVKLMRKHGVRINLRMFASKKIVAVFILFAVFSILKKAFGLFVRA
ncbi:hypothetical protein ACOSQ2_025743 [Xanthoceras sorbifolium]|uniref:Sphingomyelin phosphodiesterase 4 n=1 Tax=Xanthoceras sorbifolium TaxID=99658 RepID=A0ABQ8H6U0_9ROSI|nr:hypothetical protein JRO89_XS13G0059700 [Xanthoceras sorbifolium]